MSGCCERCDGPAQGGETPWLARGLPGRALLAVIAASALAVSTAHAADDCGPNGWRGTWGHCHYAPPVYVAPRPVIYAAPPVSTYACPPGYWRSPWGHCRDTPYHGRLPNGGWQ